MVNSTHECKVCDESLKSSWTSHQHARNGRVGTPPVTCHVGFPFSFFSFPPFLFIVTSRSTNKITFKLTTQDDLRIQIRVLSSLTASFFHFSFLSYLSSHSLEQHLPPPRHYHAAAVCSFVSFVLALTLCAHTSLFTPHHRYPRGRRYNIKLDVTDR